MMMMISTMLAITLMNLNIKSTGFACINLIMFSITTTILLSMAVKLTLMPFIIILTMLGGLIILYLYFTSSNLMMTINTETKKNKWLIFTIMLMFTTTQLTSNLLTNQSFNNYKTPKMNPDPTHYILLPQLNLPTIMMISMLLIILISLIMICSKVNSPIRRKFKS